MELSLDRGVPTEEPPCPGQGICGGLVASQEDRDRLVAKLLVSHALAVVRHIARGEQQRQQV